MFEIHETGIDAGYSKPRFNPICREDTMPSLRNVAILVFDDVEILDFAGPYEVFNDAGEITTPTAFNVYNIGISNLPVIGRGKFMVTPRYSIDDCPQADILLIPGGFGTRPLLKHERLIRWIADQSQKV